MIDNIYSILVNKENKVPSDIEQQINLLTIDDTNNKKIFIEEYTLKNYKKLKECVLKRENVLIGIGNAYRTAEIQKEIYEKFMELYGKEYANSIVAPVGFSEHQTGLAIDLEIYFTGEGFISNNKNFERTRTVFEEKIHKYLGEFGFILRYPKNKENITKYPYEPWHIRYVGEKIAKEINEKNITFEEYKKEHIVKYKKESDKDENT